MGETEDEEEAFEPLARDTNVAVAYGSIFSGSRRRWFAARILGYSDKSKKYTVIWKSIPKRGKAYFKCGSERVKEITAEIYEQAPEDGVSFLGFHRQSTFQAGEENPTVNVGDQVAVAYGAAAGDDTAVPGKFLWYAAK